jgi:hypothetical protein
MAVNKKHVLSNGYMRVAVSRRRRFEALEKCRFRCVYCGRGPDDGVVLQVDHALPVARGGDNEEDNLVASCVDCNLGKRDRVVALPARTFLGWLRLQTLRDDPVGDLSCDEAKYKFIEPASFKHLFRQLRRARLHAPVGATHDAPAWAAWHAWREYRRGERLRARNAAAHVADAVRLAARHSRCPGGAVGPACYVRGALCDRTS